MTIWWVTDTYSVTTKAQQVVSTSSSSSGGWWWGGISFYTNVALTQSVKKVVNKPKPKPTFKYPKQIFDEVDKITYKIKKFQTIKPLLNKLINTYIQQSAMLTLVDKNKKVYQDLEYSYINLLKDIKKLETGQITKKQLKQTVKKLVSSIQAYEKQYKDFFNITELTIQSYTVKLSLPTIKNITKEKLTKLFQTIVNIHKNPTKKHIKKLAKTYSQFLLAVKVFKENEKHKDYAKKEAKNIINELLDI